MSKPKLILSMLSIGLSGLLLGILIVAPIDEVADRHIADQQRYIDELQAERIWRITAFCPHECCCGEYADGITASGKPAEGFLVAAPPNIPFGTLLAIPGYADGLPVPVLDRGGAIKGNKLDVFFPTHQEALNWGVQYLKVGRAK